MQYRPLDQQVVTVVGAASGIGRATVQGFARAGARVMAVDIDEVGLRTLVAELRQEGRMVASVVADTADPEAMQRAALVTVETYGCLDTWAHIAGVGVYGTFMQIPPAEFRRVIEVNLLGEMFGAQAALPHLIRGRGGALIVVSSIEARRSLPYHSAYGASKHGITGFVQALRVELQHERLPVSVTEILPSTINTPFFYNAKTRLGVKPTGMPPYYRPESVANAILHAAVHPRREIIVGGAGKALIAADRLAPGLLDRALARVGEVLQRSSVPASPEEPNNLFGPAGKRNQVRGRFGAQTAPVAFSTWLDLHPLVRVATVTGIAVGAGALLGRGTQAWRDSPPPVSPL